MATRSIFSSFFGFVFIAYLVWLIVAGKVLGEDGRYNRACKPIDIAGNVVVSLSHIWYEDWATEIEDATERSVLGCEYTLYRVFQKEESEKCNKDTDAWKLFLKDIEGKPQYEVYAKKWTEHFSNNRFWVVCEKHSDKWRPILLKNGYYDRVEAD